MTIAILAIVGALGAYIVFMSFDRAPRFRIKNGWMFLAGWIFILIPVFVAMTPGPVSMFFDYWF